MASFRIEHLLFITTFTLYFFIQFFPLLYFYCFVVVQQWTARNRHSVCQCIRLNVSAAKVFSSSFYNVRTNCDRTKPYNKSLINLVCSVCTGKYCLRFLTHRPRSFVARSVRKPSGNTFPYRPRTRLISPYSISKYRWSMTELYRLNYVVWYKSVLGKFSFGLA